MTYPSDVVVDLGPVGNEPCIRGRRVSVLQVLDLDDVGLSPAEIATELRLEVGEVVAALEWAAEHPERIAEARESVDAVFDDRE